MFHIAVCDDDDITCSEIEKVIFNYSKQSLEGICVEIFRSGEEICHSMISGEIYDLIFLDIELKIMNGIEVARIIREKLKNEIVKIVFISARDSYYLELFDVRPMHFLHKPLKADNIINDIEKAMDLMGRQGHVFTFRKGYNTYKKSIRDILYFESSGRKLKMTSIDDESIFYGTIAEVYRELEKYRFFFSHQSFLINYTHVIEFGRKELTMSNKRVLPISRHKSNEVMGLLLKYEKEGK